MFGIGGPLVVVLVVAAIPLMRGRDGLAFLSGLLACFGVAWLVLLARQSSTNGEDLAPWVAIGIGALVTGVALGAIRLAIAGSGPTARSEPDMDVRQA